MLKRILSSKWFSPVILFALGFIVVSIYDILPSVISAGNEVKNLQNKIAEVDKKTAELEKIKEFAGTEASLERQARQKLNYKKPNEKVVYIYENPYNQKADENAGQQTVNNEKNASIWEKIMDWLLKR